MRFLVVDDEPAIADAVAHALAAEGWESDIAHDGTDGLWLAREGEYDGIVLDILLPGINGYEVCRTLREEGVATPILMLTAKRGEHDEAEGLDLGADDYLTKPFSTVVLTARLRALGRRAATAPQPDLAHAGLRYRPGSRECELDDTEIRLTPREGTVLEALLRAAPDVLPKDRLLTQVWGPEFDGDPNVVDVYLGYLRKKLGRERIETIRGAGYRLVDGPS